MKAIKVFTTTIITTAIFALIVAFGANADASRADRKKNVNACANALSFNKKIIKL